MKNGQKKAWGVWRKATALGAVSLLGLAGAAGAAAAGQAAAAGETAPVQGVQAHVDPATGQLRQPTSAEVKAFSDAVRALFAQRVATAAQVTQHADGSISAALGPESLNVWVATVGVDGSLHQVCVEGAGAAGAAAPALEVK